MRIVFVCGDNTGSLPGNIVDWINKKTENTAILIYGYSKYNFKIPAKSLMMRYSYMERIFNILYNSDIIIFNDPMIPGISYHFYNQFKEEIHVDFSDVISNKKVIRMANGTYYRKNHKKIILEQISKYNLKNIITTPDLFYNNEDIWWIPFANILKETTEVMKKKWLLKNLELYLPYNKHTLKGVISFEKIKRIKKYGVNVVNIGRYLKQKEYLEKLEKDIHFFPSTLTLDKSLQTMGLVNPESMSRFVFSFCALSKTVKERWIERTGSVPPVVEADITNIDEKIIEVLNWDYDKKIKYLKNAFEWAKKYYHIDKNMEKFMELII